MCTHHVSPDLATWVTLLEPSIVTIALLGLPSLSTDISGSWDSFPSMVIDATETEPSLSCRVGLYLPGPSETLHSMASPQGKVLPSVLNGSPWCPVWSSVASAPAVATLSMPSLFAEAAIATSRASSGFSPSSSAGSVASRKPVSIAPSRNAGGRVSSSGSRCSS